MLTNTVYLSEAANDYKKNKGIYTKAPEGTREFKEYWKEHNRRCIEGYSVGDIKITGRNYFYLNFFPMWVIPESSLKNRNKVSAQVDKVQDFPRFMEVQYNWWWAKQIALKGISVEDYNNLGLQFAKVKPEHLVGGKHIACAKTRGCGFSYMEAADGVYNYIFIPGSKSYYFASHQDYLIKDGILTKAWDALEFLNTKTQRYFKRNRQVKDQVMHKRSSYLDKVGDEHGYKSEIMGTIVDDPNKVRGKRGIKLSFEEAGSFKNLKQAIEMARPLVEQGGFINGQISAFGTGGEEGPSLEGLEAFFYHPDEYNMMEFINIWEGEEKISTSCGFFVPADIASDKYIDADGNADRDAAREFHEGEREKKRKSKDPKGLDRRTAEFPFNPSELFQRINSNIFNIGETRKQIDRVKSNRDIVGLIQNGILTYGKDGLEFDPTADVTPILDYPHKQDGDLKGCITQIETPYKDQYGKTPDDLYFIVVDPFYKDDAEDKTSLGSIQVWMRSNIITGHTTDRKVAWFNGRPTLDTFHRNIFLMAEYWNAKIQSEIAGGGQGIIDYARNKKLLHMLEFEPEMLHNKEIASNQKNRAYLMNMTTERKKLGIIYYADWLMTPIAITETGEVIYNLNREYDLGQLEEIRRYNDEDNFDRISCSILAMFMLKEKAAIEIQAKQKTSSIFNRTFFSDNDNGDYSQDLEMLGFRPGIDF
jgi:hypothetical protein